MKVAVPVKDDTLEIVTRTGRAPFFALFHVEKDKFELIKLIKNGHSHGHGHGHGHSHEGHHQHGAGERKHRHHDGAIYQDGDEKFQMDSFKSDEVEDHRRGLGELKDCDYILCRALGPNMGHALELEGVKPIQFKKADGDSAKELIYKFQATLT